jgi:hypothetical protein
MDGLVAVCSSSSRPSVQRTGKGNQWWRREVYHLAGIDGKTVCGRDCRDWLSFKIAGTDSNCCVRCATSINGKE